MLPSHILLAIAAVSVSPVAAQFGNMFANMFKQQQQQQQPDSSWIEHTYDNAGCEGYLCEDTMTCVHKPVDCPCVFPNSQIKCVLPDQKSYVCISKPAEGDPEPRDCDFVARAYKGLV